MSHVAVKKELIRLAHEVAHLLIGKGGVFNFRDSMPADNAVEQFCNRVAAEFLLPEREMKAAWPDARKAIEPFQVLARRFKVSPLVAARRSLDLDMISKSAFFDFYREYQEDERRRKTTKASIRALTALRRSWIVAAMI